jgi:thiol-disulfide isomerase/thioredoxin
MKYFFIFTGILIVLGFQDKPIPIVDYKGLEPYLNKQNDTTYVINFWATWCKPCITELPYFEQLNQNYMDKKVKVILVSLDFMKSYDSQLVPFVKRKGLKSMVMLLNDPDSNSWIDKIDKQWTGAIPATLIYNKTSRSFYEKELNYNELDSLVQLKL